VSVVTPLRDAMKYLPETVPSVLHAARNTGGVELIYVDNGSTDGSYEFLARIPDIRVLRHGNGSIAAARNAGAAAAHGEYLSFLDADCTIGPRYFDDALDVMRTSGAAATGFRVEPPSEANWVEATWHNLHAAGVDRDVDWINSANFFISREVFERIGGFREDLRTGEDAEIGQRLVRAGYRLWATRRLTVTHLGNPKSIAAFFRQKVWQGLGMFGTVKRDSLDKPTAMMFVHLAATIGMLGILFADRLNWALRILLALALQLVVPIVTVAYRVWRNGKAVDVPKAIFLYWVYYWARLEALFLVLVGHGDKYVK
jgi:glycosyltransferase involved in cell wall biosynthesis